jgi:hypothetical protein
MCAMFKRESICFEETPTPHDPKPGSDSNPSDPDSTAPEDYDS